jgi:hypothetical protein
MIRRDYILRMIEEFVRALARINEQKRNQLWHEAETSLEDQAKRLTGTDLATIVTLTDTELLGSLLQTGDFQAQTEKAFILARVLIEAAEVADAENREESSRAFRLKALHLVLHTALRTEVFEWPEFVPTIDLLLQRFVRAQLPVHTQALLMQHFERTGQFAKAEDALYVLLELAPDNPALRELGISFYHRLLDQPDAALESGELPRSEVEFGLAEIRNLPLFQAGPGSDSTPPSTSPRMDQA